MIALSPFSGSSLPTDAKTCALLSPLFLSFNHHSEGRFLGTSLTLATSSGVQESEKVKWNARRRKREWEAASPVAQ